jgi:DNA-binding HxlR family transcriptional regulator
MKDERFCNSNCPFTRAIGTIGNKWKPIIINVLGTRTMRFGQLDAIVPHISRKGADRTVERVGRRWAYWKDWPLRNYRQG